jgi:hypothetical protein
MIFIIFIIGMIIFDMKKKIFIIVGFMGCKMAKLIYKVVESCAICPYFQWDNQVESYYCRETKIYFLNGENQKRGNVIYWEQIIADFCKLEDHKEIDNK